MLLRCGNNLDGVDEDFYGLGLQLEPRHANAQLAHKATLEGEWQSRSAQSLDAQREVGEHHVPGKGREAQRGYIQVLKVPRERAVQRALEHRPKEALHSATAVSAAALGGVRSPLCGVNTYTDLLTVTILGNLAQARPA